MGTGIIDSCISNKRGFKVCYVIIKKGIFVNQRKNGDSSTELNRFVRSASRILLIVLAHAICWVGTVPIFSS
jgi:hypothetical protein